MKRLVIGLVLAAIVMSLAFSLPSKRMSVSVAVAERKAIREYVEDLGKTRLPDIHRITMPLQGRILPISLYEGEPVSAGQVVAKLDTSDLETDLLERTNTVKRWQKNLDAFDLVLKTSAETVRAGQAKYEFAKSAFDRSERLAESNAVSEEQREANQLRVIEADVDLRKDQWNESLALISQGIIELFQETDIAKKAKAQRDRNRAEIRSPVDGVVLSRNVSNERVLQPGDVLLEIGDLSKLEVEVDVLTRDAARIQVGDPVDIAGVTSADAPLSGTVAQIFPRGFTKESSLGVEEQRVKVIVQFDPQVLPELEQAGESLGVDYRGRVMIYTDEQEDAVTIPRAALFRSAAGNWQTFAIRDGKATLTDVEVGLRNDFEVQITSGISEGGQVILAPDSDLTDGQVVEPLELGVGPSDAKNS